MDSFFDMHLLTFLELFCLFFCFLELLRNFSCENSRLQESQILQISSEILFNFAFLTSLYKNRKFCKFVTMSNISYKILITFLQKMHFFRKKFLQKCDVLFRPKFHKPSNFQQQQPQLPLTMHKLSQDPSKRVQIVNFEQEELHAILPQKLL